MQSSLQKHWKKVILTLVSLFWSSCDGDSSTKAPAIDECDGDDCVLEDSSSSTKTSSSSFMESSSSSEILGSSTALYGVFYSSENTVFPSSSSADILGSSTALYGVFYSSSEASSSSSLTGLYRLFSDTSVTCNVKYGDNFLQPYTPKSESVFCYDIESALEDHFNSLEKIIALENKLETCFMGGAPVYGVMEGINRLQPIYTCSNNKTYKPLTGSAIIVLDNFLYTVQEFNARLMSDSSLTPEELNSRIIGYKRSDFHFKSNLGEATKKEKQAEIIAILNDTENPISEEKRACLVTILDEFIPQCGENNCIPRAGYHDDTVIAKTKIDPDGTTSENERYTNFINEIKDAYDKEISTCNENQNDQ